MIKLLGICVLLAVVGCNKEKKQGDQNSSEGNDDVPQQASGDKNPTSALEVIKNEYEACRKLLAADSTKGIREHAKKIVSISEASSQKSKLSKMTLAANELASTKGDDIAAVRLLFGNMSEQLIAYLREDSSMSKDIHVFECPMAKGYKKWIQPNDKLENPYMGSSMLHCGSKSSF